MSALEINVDKLPAEALAMCANHTEGDHVIATHLLRLAGQTIPLCEKCADEVHGAAAWVGMWMCN
jgi:hypothetical protein